MLRKRTIHQENTSKKLKLNNNGYDNENDDYIVREGEVWADVYKVEKLIGTGSFGQVVRATHLETFESVAIKIIKNRPSFAEQAQVEIKLLDVLNQQPKEFSKIIGIIFLF